MTFDILNRHQSLAKSCLIEASAGTGKTFSIENILVRLLINEPHLKISEILSLTFTRAATKDLKNRILANLKKSIQLLKDENIEAPDYLREVIEQGPEKKAEAIFILEQALYSFDEAQIFTIHGFCLRMLSYFVFDGELSLSSPLEEKTIDKKSLLVLIRDFFKVGLLPHKYSKGQLEILLNNYKENSLPNQILNLLNQDHPFEEISDFHVYYEEFLKVLNFLKENKQFEKVKLQSDFDQLTFFYKGEKPTFLDQFIAFFAESNWTEKDFDLFLLEGPSLFDYFSKENINLKKIKNYPDTKLLFYPDLIATLDTYLKPFVQKAGQKESLLLKLANDCSDFIKNYLNDEEKHQESDLLRLMLKSLSNPFFKENVQKLYKIAIIDEFQDTDPIQWEIFKTLFNEKKLFLVGDPKQSIYAFRQADIYTYLEAAKLLGQEACFSLNTNFRSQKPLVESLNILFSLNKELFALPRISEKSFLPFPLVQGVKEEYSFYDKQFSVHFYEMDCVLKKNKSISSKEEDQFFSFILQEILSLHKMDGFLFSQFAVLVKDKHQAKRLGQALRKIKIPYKLQKQESLLESPIFDSFCELLSAILQPMNESSLKIALGGLFLSWTHNHIKEMSAKEHESLIQTFLNLRHLWKTKGFGIFFEELLSTVFHEKDCTLAENLITRIDGDEYLNDLEQIASYIMEKQQEVSLLPEEILNSLLQLKQNGQEEESLNKLVDKTKDGISIITIHSSKGLEFDVVFAQGLIYRPPAPSLIIPKQINNSSMLIACKNNQEEDYLNYCLELDAEKIRQLYVALTRAKLRLYIPIVNNTAKSKEVDPGCKSAMEVFQSTFPFAHFKEFVDCYKNHFSYTHLNHISFDIKPLITHKHFDFTYYEPPIVIQEKKIIQSFTSLVKYKTPLQMDKDQKISAPNDFNCLEKNRHTLPAGKETGTLLHLLFEHLDFSLLPKVINPDFFIPYVHSFTQKSVFAPWKEVIAEILYLTLTKEIEGFSLQELSSDNCYKEMEFLYPQNRSLRINEWDIEKGFFKGVIDFIFKYQDKYYIIDWKSNWLGMDDSYYTLSNLENAMQEHSYYTQETIYKEALKKYLAIIDQRPFIEIYGGTYYVFLRGLNTQGIFKVIS